MNNIRPLRLLTIGSLLLLMACASVPSPVAPVVPPTEQPDGANEYVGTTVVSIAADATIAGLEQQYGGEVVLFRPEAGFAVVGFTTASSVMPDDLEDNEDTFSTPVTALGSAVLSEGFTSWSGGFTSWSGGFTSWSGGFTSWSGGFTSWSGGEPVWTGDDQTHTPLDNLNLWNRIRLPWAHRVADRLGEGVIVAVIDTGIDLAHPAFEGRLLPGRDFIDNDDDPQEEPGDAYGHGTGVAGVIVQVAPLASIMPIRVLDGDGMGDTDDVAQAIDWAVAQGADVINLSLGSDEVSRVMLRMLQYAASKDVLVVTSTGNSGDNRVTFPASRSVGKKWESHLIGVGSVDSNDVKSLFSTYHGWRVEMVAPGEFVFTAVPDERVGYWSGTSFAAPMVTGALALALGQPNLDAAPEDLGENVVNDSSNEIYDIPENWWYTDFLGSGRLNLRRFLDNSLDRD